MSNISISTKNGYNLEKVLKAKKYLKEIGTNKRTFDFNRLIDMYNDIFSTNVAYQTCRCQSPKYFNGIANYFKYGKLTLINNGLATESDFNDEEIEASVKDSSLETQNEASEPLKEDEPRPSKGLEGNEVELPTVIKEEENKPLTEAENAIIEKKKIGRPRKNKE